MSDFNDEESKILIVDDDLLSNQLLKGILEPFYEIHIAVTGEEAITEAAKIGPDIILLDILMPNKNGFDILIQLKNMEMTRNIPIMFITGIDNMEVEEKALFLGAVDYIRKPFHSPIVKARVKTHVQIVRQLKAIEKTIMIDYLLDISNRRYFDKQLVWEWQRAIRRKHPISILMMDLDFFKKYNDTYGHPQGDLMLQSVARLLKGIILRHRNVLARYGGEELIALLPEVELEYAVEIAEIIRKKVEKNKVLCIDKDIITGITISIGVTSIIPDATDHYQDLVKRSDEALYMAKQNGRNQVCYKV